MRILFVSIALACLASVSCIRTRGNAHAIANTNASGIWYDQPPEVGTAIGIYNLVKSLLEIVSNRKDVDAVSRSRITGNVMSDIETLYALHDKLQEKLGFTAQRDDCNNCTDADIDELEMFKFNRLTFGHRSFESANQYDCVHGLKKQILHMRSVLKDLELTALTNVKNLSSTTLEAEDMIELFELDIHCEGKDIAADALAEFYEDSIDEDGQKIGHCRELPGLRADEAQAACVEQCLKMRECAGFTYLDGVDDELINGHRCCFRTEITVRTEQEDTNCFVASRARFSMKSDVEVEQWFRDSGYANYVEKTFNVTLNGLALSTLTRQKLKDYIGNDMSDEDAAKIKCLIDTEIVGVDAHACDEESAVDRYLEKIGVIDPFVFFGVKSGNSAYLSHNWIMGMGARVLALGQKFFFGGKDHSPTIRRIENVLNTALGWSFAYDSVHGLVDEMYVASSFNPLSIANCVTLLVKTRQQQFWDSCDNVYGLLMKQNIWEDSVNA